MTEQGSKSKKEKEYLISKVEELKQGKESAFQEFYELTYKYVYSTIYKNINDAEAVKDIHQETYIAIYRGISSLENSSAILSWIAQVAYNKTLNYLRKNKHEVLLFEESTLIDNEEESDYALLPEDAMQDKEVQRLLKEIIDELPQMQKLAIISYYYNELSVEETAKALEIPVGTVKTNLYRARKKIKLAVEELASKKDTKLYSTSYVPLLLLLFKKEVEAMEVPKGLQEETIKQVKRITNETKYSTGAESVAEPPPMSTTESTSKVTSAFSSLIANKVAMVAIIAILATGSIGVLGHIISKNNQKDNISDVTNIEEKQDHEQQTIINPTSVAEVETAPLPTPTIEVIPMSPIEIPIGESYMVDLDNDGIEEEVYYNAVEVNRDTQEPEYEISFEINNVDNINVLKKSERNFGGIFSEEKPGYPFNTIPIHDYNQDYYIVDIDVRDNYKEIAFELDYPDVGGLIYFFRYDTGGIECIGLLYSYGGINYGTYINGDGSITVESSTNLLTPHRWIIEEKYKINDEGKLKYVEETFYEGKNFSQSSQSHTLLIDLPVYESPDKNSNSKKLTGGTKVNFFRTDNKNWVSLTTENEEEFWFYIDGIDNDDYWLPVVLINEEEVYIYDIFTDLFNAG